MYHQLDIWWVDLEPVKGAETKKKRPCVIVQSDWMNASSRTYIIAPLLPHHKDWPFVINLKPTRKNGLDKDRHINLKQMRVVDVSRLGEKQGKLEPKYRERIEDVIQMVFGVGEYKNLSAH